MSFGYGRSRERFEIASLYWRAGWARRAGERVMLGIGWLNVGADVVEVVAAVDVDAFRSAEDNEVADSQFDIISEPVLST